MGSFYFLLIYTNFTSKIFCILIEITSILDIRLQILYERLGFPRVLLNTKLCYLEAITKTKYK